MSSALSKPHPPKFKKREPIPPKPIPLKPTPPKLFKAQPPLSKKPIQYKPHPPIPSILSNHKFRTLDCPEYDKIEWEFSE